MEFIDLIKHIPGGGQATAVTLALFALWGLYKLGMRYLGFLERKAEREAKAAAEDAIATRLERKEALEREHGREAVHRQATVEAIERLQDAVADCEEDRRNLRRELDEASTFFAKDLGIVKRSVATLSNELETVKAVVLPADGGQTAPEQTPKGPPAATIEAEGAQRAAPAASKPKQQRTSRPRKAK